MNQLICLRRTALAVALLAGLGGAAQAAAASPSTANTNTPAALPGNSLYRLDAPLTDTAGQRFTLREMAGAPVLVTMFYGDCNAACPIIIETMKRTVAALGPEGKPLRVLMISLDPMGDSPAGLAALAGKHGMPAPQFRLAVARDESQTRLIASALNIKFRALGNGEINHTTRVVLLDAAGSPQAASSRLDIEPDPVLLKQIALLLKKAPRGIDQVIAK